MKSMTAISIHLPNRMVQMSLRFARQLQISRAEFIRMAIEHEIKRLQIMQEQIAMAKAFSAMKKNKRYLRESEEIMDGFDTPINTEEEGGWWKKK